MNDKALLTAITKHSGATRRFTGEPRVCHSIRVWSLVRDALFMKPRHTQLGDISLLHDTLEETDLTREEILLEFGEFVLNGVVALTNVYTHEKFPHVKREQRFALELERLKMIQEDYFDIKLADMWDNLHSLNHTIIEENPKVVRLWVNERRQVMEAIPHGLFGLRSMVTAELGRIQTQLDTL